MSGLVRWVGALVVLVVVGGTLWDATRPKADSGTTLAGGAFALAAIAALAALFAYAESVRAPVLTWSPRGPILNDYVRLPLTTSSTTGNREPDDGKFWYSETASGSANLELSVINYGSATARNVLVTLTFRDARIYCLRQLPATPWRPLNRDSTNYATVFQWDGGVDFAVHGGGRFRLLPDFTPAQICLMSRLVPHVEIDVVCDGFDRHKPTRAELKALTPPT